MASKQFDQYCSLCLEDDETVVAVTWCTECETFLCDICEKHHKKSKASKQHSIISVQEYQNLPEFILQTSNRCSDHDKKCEFYCSFHEAACCIKCMKDSHNNCGCKDIDALADVTENIKSSASVSQLQKDLQDLKENFDTITKHCSTRITDIQKQREDCMLKVHEIRKSVNDHLDKLENKLLAELNSEHMRIKSNIESIKLDVESKQKQIDILQSNLDDTLLLATNFQTYFGLNTLEKMKNEVLEFLNVLNTEGRLKDTNLDVLISDTVTSLLDDGTELGKVNTFVKDSPLQLDKIKTCQAQLLEKSEPKSMDQIRPVFKNKFNIGPACRITGCQILSDCNMLFIDAFNKTLLMFYKNGGFVRTVFQFSDEPKDLCQIKTDTVAVTLPKMGKVNFVNVASSMQIKTIKIGKSCTSISCNGEEIIVGMMENLVLILDIDGNVLNQFEVQGKYLMRISFYGNNICYSDRDTNCLYCYNMAGNMLWSFNHPQIQNPLGNASDVNGLVYVASKNNNKLLVFSPDTMKMNVILSEQDGIKDPCALYIDKKNSALLITNLYGGNVFLFQI